MFVIRETIIFIGCPIHAAFLIFILMAASKGVLASI
jgi:hypothetical protein